MQYSSKYIDLGGSPHDWASNAALVTFLRSIGARWETAQTIGQVACGTRFYPTLETLEIWRSQCPEVYAMLR